MNSAPIDPAPKVGSSDLLGLVNTHIRNMTDEEKAWPGVAILAGPPIVIEIIVQTAAQKCGHPMNWGYIAGRAIVRSSGNAAECRRALYAAIPQSDLTMSDMLTGKPNAKAQAPVPGANLNQHETP